MPHRHLNDYQNRCLTQTERWAAGEPVHNFTDEECCPDFSCCEPKLFTQSEAERQRILDELRDRYGVALL